MFGIGGFELFLILLFGFLIFGPDKLPVMARMLGKAISKFRSAQEEMSRVIKEEVYDPDSDEPFKDPIEAFTKAGDALKESVSKNPAKKTGQSASTNKKNTSSASTGASTKAAAYSASKAESFTERKARYERERAAKKAADAAAAEAKAAETESAKAAEAEAVEDAAAEVVEIEASAHEQFESKVENAMQSFDVLTSGSAKAPADAAALEEVSAVAAPLGIGLAEEAAEVSEVREEED